MSVILSAFALALRLLRGLVAGAIFLLFSYMIVAVTAQVLGRYVFNFTIAWATETSTMAQIWLALLGAGYAMHKGLHVGIAVVADCLPPSLQRPLNVVVTLLAIWFLWVVFQGSFKLLAIGSLQTSPALQIPMFYPYLILPIGSAYLALELVLAQLPKIIGRPSENEPAEAELEKAV